ncbi:MAG: hypothetical protein HQM09_18860 [Candidatus Riflebacteria bacterium]|nr:hypothetical protein [Candidatus Riflebacteria bacterium]
MPVQELLAIYRSCADRCQTCRRIVSRYEKTLLLSELDRKHLEDCIFTPEN